MLAAASRSIAANRSSGSRWTAWRQRYDKKMRCEGSDGAAGAEDSLRQRTIARVGRGSKLCTGLLSAC